MFIPEAVQQLLCQPARISQEPVNDVEFQISRVCRKSDRVETVERQVRCACDRAEGRRRTWKLASRATVRASPQAAALRGRRVHSGAYRRRFLSHRVRSNHKSAFVNKFSGARSRCGCWRRSRVNIEHLGGKCDGRLRQLSSRDHQVPPRPAYAACAKLFTPVSFQTLSLVM